jgi:hypothetical protein
MSAEEMVKLVHCSGNVELLRRGPNSEEKTVVLKWGSSMDWTTYGQMNGATMEKITSTEHADSRNDHLMDEFIRYVSK